MLQQHPSLDKLLQTSVVILERINVYTCEICETVYCKEESLVRHLVKHMKCKGTLENNTESTPRSNQKKPDSTTTCATSRKPSSVDNDMYSKTRQPQISIRDRIRLESDSDDAQGDTDSSEDNTTGDFEPLNIEQDASSSSSEVLNMSFLGKTSQHCKEKKSKPSSVTSKLTKLKQTKVRSGADNCDQVGFQTGHRQSQTVKRYTCEICKKSFSKKRGLDAHEKLHSLEKTFMCEICEQLFMFKHQLKVHERRHTDEKPYSCKVCNKSFRYGSGIGLHIRSYHPNLKNPCEPTALPTCAICKMRFSQKTALLRHIYQCHITTGYHCSICRKEFGHPVVRDMHMKLHQGTNLKCSVCGKCFQARFYLTRCELSHKKLYECPNCTTKFGRKYHLERHMKEACKQLNQKETPFKCTNCNKKFARNHQLTTHIKYFCKPHECARCKERFVEATTLKIHENNKICKRKMYECNMCNKSFRKKGFLVRHISNLCKTKKRLRK